MVDLSGVLAAPASGWLAAAAVLVACLLRRRHERRTAERERALVSTFHLVDDAVLTLDVRGRVLAANPTAEQLLGACETELRGVAFDDLVELESASTPTDVKADEPPDRCGDHARTEPGGGRDADRSADVVLARVGGRRAVVEVRRAGTERAGRSPAEIVAMRDVTELVQLRRQLARQATHDHLTGLPNRRFVDARLPMEIARARCKASSFGLLIVDVDRFREVNERFGSRVGDALLRHMASTLRRCCGPDRLLARIGVDEFLIVATGIDGREALAALAKRVLDSFAGPLALDERCVHVDIAVGLSLLGDDVDDAGELLRRAGLALHEAKHKRGAFRFFTPEVDTVAAQEMAIRDDLREAVDAGRFDLVYQPKVDMASERILGFEALLRWSRRDGTPVPPDRFIPIAENAGLVEAITEWVIDRAVAQLGRWRLVAALPLTMSVNVSARHFLDPTLVEHVHRSLEAAGVPPSALIVEITESMLMQQPQKAAEVMRMLKAAGVRIAIDDFGTGYSSLAYLRDFPVDEIKIDRSFAKRIGGNERDDLIVTAIARMSQSLRIDAVAEGVERPDQQAFLESVGVRIGQGFLFSRPLSAAAAQGLLHRESAPQHPT